MPRKPNIKKYWSFITKFEKIDLYFVETYLNYMVGGIKEPDGGDQDMFSVFFENDCPTNIAEEIYEKSVALLHYSVDCFTQSNSSDTDNIISFYFSEKLSDETISWLKERAYTFPDVYKNDRHKNVNGGSYIYFNIRKMPDIKVIGFDEDYVEGIEGEN